MAGLLTRMFEDAPDAPGFVPLDPQAQQLLNQSTYNAQLPYDNFEQNQTQGSSDYAGTLSGKSANQSAAASGENPYLKQAIVQKYQTLAGKGIQKTKDQASAQAPLQRADALAKTSAAALGQQQAMTSQYSFLTNVYNQQEAARAQFINQIFQTGAVGYGMAKGGGFGKSSNKSNVGGSMFGGGPNDGPQTPPTPYEQAPSYYA